MHLRKLFALVVRVVRLHALALPMLMAFSVLAEENANGAASSLARENVFALGGVGVAGTMSSGEKNLRAVLKETDAVQQLQSLLKDASPAGQLYALLEYFIRGLGFRAPSKTGDSLIFRAKWRTIFFYGVFQIEAKVSGNRVILTGPLLHMRRLEKRFLSFAES